MTSARRPLDRKPCPRCSIEGCGKPVHGRGWCNAHHMRFLRTGDPTGSTRKPEGERFLEKIDRNGANGCWLWTGVKNDQGYGQIVVAGHRTIYAHRFAYEVLVGPIPDGLTIDHLCRVRHCVNPAHLEPVTNRENCLRGESQAAQQARQTHCIRGHPFDGANTYRRPDNGARQCRACGRIRDARRRLARRQ